MKRSEYDIQAYVNDSLNRQHGLDSPEGSAAVTQANKPEVDATDMQKEQLLAKYEEKQSTVTRISLVLNLFKDFIWEINYVETIDELQRSPLEEDTSDSADN